MSKNIGCRALISSCRVTRSTMGTNVRVFPQVEVEAHRINEFKLFLQSVGSR